MAFYVVERRRGLSGGGISDGIGYEPAVPTGATTISPKTIQNLMTARPPRPDQLTTDAMVRGGTTVPMAPSGTNPFASDAGMASGLPSWVKWGGLALLVAAGGYIVYRIVR